MLSLYIHIPYCKTKCPYCGFYSTLYNAVQADRFLSNLMIEASLYRDEFFSRTFGSIYIGGGTPTILSRRQLDHLFDIIGYNFHCAHDTEFTIEANPNSVSVEILETLLEHGVNRLSLGVQSFSDTILCTLGRTHGADQAFEAFQRARVAGFRNIGIDLIYGIPGQTTSQWEETLSTTISLAPEHVSVYSLSVDDGSLFSHQVKTGNVFLPDDEITAHMYDAAVSALTTNGFDRYEVSNFSVPDFKCHHNENYWKRGEYLGMGPSAWSFVGERRYNTVANIKEYNRSLETGAVPIESHEIVTTRNAARETIMLGLRTQSGLDLAEFEKKYGASLLKELNVNSTSLFEAALLINADGHLRFTDRGFILSDTALARLSI